MKISMNKYFFLLSAVLIIMGSSSFGQDEASEVVNEEETPVVLEEIAGERNLTGIRPWRAPNYSGQQGALGWTEETFKVPAGLETNYKFWLDVYTKYSTDQGVLHDSEYIDLIYEVLDFTHISQRTDLTDGQKHRLRTKAVKEGKKRVVEMLKKFEKVTDPATLDFNEKRVWDYFQKIEGSKKYSEAASKNRLRFQLGQRDRIIQGIFFSGRYLEDFEQIFQEAGLPKELTRLPFVESSYNVLARSKVGASGLWQIMRYTGRPFMMINSTVDKRNYPKDATRVAAKLLRINYNMLESWPLALTGYNHGPAGVLKLTKLYKSREIGDLVVSNGSKKRLGFASRNFYASFLAILEAEKNAPQYFGQVYWSQSLNAIDIKLDQPVRYKDILAWFGGNDRATQVYNPHITANARKFGKVLPIGSIISIPTAKEKEVLAELENRKKDISKLVKDDAIEAARSYIVAKGDTISSIAREFGVSMKELLATNDLDSPHKLRVGQTLKIP